MSNLRLSVDQPWGFDMYDKIMKFVQDECGATAIEYGLIAALISVAAVVAMTALGSSLNNMFTTVSTTLDAAVASTTSG